MTDDAVGSEVAVQGMDVERLMEVAIEKEGAIDVIKELVGLRNAEMDRQAEHAMNDALHRFKAKCPPIPRAKAGAKLSNRDGSSATRLFYADLDTIQAIVDPILAQCGLTYAWSNEATTEVVVTRCILTHVMGATRESAMALPVSGPPKSSKTQAHSGTRTFGKRLTLSDVLGIATMDDGDGADETGETISDEQLATLEDIITEGGVDRKAFLEYAQLQALGDLRASDYDRAKRELEENVKARKES